LAGGSELAMGVQFPPEAPMNIKKAKVIMEVEIEGREGKLEFDLTDEEAQKVIEILNRDQEKENK